MSGVPFKPKNKLMYNSSGSGPGIYTGYGTTKTAQNSTLFVTNIPSGVNIDEVQSIFATNTGFQQLRTVRAMVFVDFYDIQQATAAMVGTVCVGLALAPFSHTIPFSPRAHARSAMRARWSCHHIACAQASQSPISTPCRSAIRTTCSRTTRCSRG